MNLHVVYQNTYFSISIIISLFLMLLLMTTGHRSSAVFLWRVISQTFWEGTSIQFMITRGQHESKQSL